jgi:cellulose synthase/poly-beta-1,6-N-acetylglucosamine synthase-like glycosyltransferase
MTVFYTVAFSLLTAYAILIIAYWAGWERIPYFKKPSTYESDLTYTIVIPVRNEEAHIAACLESIVKQQVESQKFDVLIVNDHSTDATAQIVNEYIQQHKLKNFRLVHMTDDRDLRKLKKAAITYAVEQAKGTYIVLTDGDCIRGEHWLTTIDSYLAQHRHKMVYAPVAFSATTLFERFQALEFAGLVAIGGAAIQLRYPNMCSAANLIFERQVFHEVGGYSGNEYLASGDDEFLLHKVHKRYPDAVSFLKHVDAIVHTTANSTLHQLSEQRKRWVSKSFHYANRYITAILAGAYLFNAAVVVMFFVNFYAGLILLLGKTLVELLFLQSVMRFFRKTEYLLLLPAAEIFHILYVLIIGLLANTASYTWKERTLK